MLLFLFGFLQLLSGGHLVCLRKLLSEHEGADTQDVFVDQGDANTFLRRHLLLNRFDFEMFVQGNLERECIEEVCNYEEAREVFENIPDTDKFWKKYTEDHASGSSRVDVTALLVGLICSAVVVFILVILIWYFCKDKKSNFSRASSIQGHPRRSNASLIMHRLEEVSRQPMLPPLDIGDPPGGLPTYEEAILRNGPHDAPPPPYPGSRPGSVRR